MRCYRVMRFYQPFPAAIPLYRAGYPRVTHPSATKFRITRFHLNSVRLACIKHAASVHPEPGSNSRIKFIPLRRTSDLFNKPVFPEIYIC